MAPGSQKTRDIKKATYREIKKILGFLIYPKRIEMKKESIVKLEVIVLSLLALLHLFVPVDFWILGDYYESHIYRSSFPFAFVFFGALIFNIGLAYLLFAHLFFKKINIHIRIFSFWIIFVISATFVKCWGVLVILEHAFA
jgi:hypothetical protein